MLQVGMQNNMISMKGNLAISRKITYVFTPCPNHLLLEIYPEVILENYKNMYELSY